MFDINWSELLILAVVALIVVGPKELPVLLRTLGKYAGTARRHANEFRAHFEQAMHEAELAELREEMERVKRDVMNSVNSAEDALKSTGDALSGGGGKKPESAVPAVSADAAPDARKEG